MPVTSAFRFATLFLYLSLCLPAQIRAVPRELLGERLIAVVPMVGSGKTLEDPLRPKFTPNLGVGLTPTLPKASVAVATPLDPAKLEADLLARKKKQIVAFSYVFSDDRTRAIVEFVAHDREAFKEILAEPGVLVVDRVSISKNAADLTRALTSLRLIKKDFDWSMLRTPGL